MKKTILCLILCLTHALSNNGWQAIHQAIFKGNIQKIETLLNEDTIEATTKAGLTPLHMAIKKRDLKLVKLLIQKGADVDAQDKKGFSVLYYAVIQNQLKIAKILLDNDADPNLTNNIGNAPIHNIAYNNRFLMLELFMNYETDFTLKNAYGMLPSDFAQKNNHSTIMKALKPLEKLNHD